MNVCQRHLGAPSPCCLCAGELLAEKDRAQKRRPRTTANIAMPIHLRTLDAPTGRHVRFAAPSTFLPRRA
jgi:hypothetical protein